MSSVKVEKDELAMSILTVQAITAFRDSYSTRNPAAKIEKVEFSIEAGSGPRVIITYDGDHTWAATSADWRTAASTVEGFMKTGSLPGYPHEFTKEYWK